MKNKRFNKKKVQKEKNIMDKVLNLNNSMSNPLNSDKFEPYMYNNIYILSKYSLELISSKNNKNIIINEDLIYFNYISDNETYVWENNDYFEAFFLKRNLVQNIDFILVNEKVNSYLIDLYDKNYISIKWKLIWDENGFNLDLFNYFYLNIFMIKSDIIDRDFIIVKNNTNLVDFINNKFFEDFEIKNIIVANPFIKNEYLNILFNDFKGIKLNDLDESLNVPLNKYVINKDYLILINNNNFKLDNNYYNNNNLDIYLCYNCNNLINDKENFLTCNCSTFLFCNIDCYYKLKNKMKIICKKYNKINNKFLENLKNINFDYKENKLFSFYNIGNTCYLNSVLQFIFLNKDIKFLIYKFFLDKDKINENINFYENRILVALYDILIRKDYLVVDPYFLKKSLEKIDELVI